MPTCPSCGHSWSTVRRIAFEPTDTTGLSDKALMALYHRTAPVLDCAFVVRHHPELASLVPDHPTPADARRLFDAARTIGRTPATEDQFWSAVRAYTARKRRAFEADPPPGAVVSVMSFEIWRDRAHVWPLLGDTLFS